MGANEKRKIQRLAKKVSHVKAKESIKRNSASSTRKKQVNDNNDTISSNILSIKENCANASILPYVNKFICGQLANSQYRNVTKACIINQAKRFKAYKILNEFQRRVTSITWHSIYSHIVAAASKFGELAWFNLNIPISKNLPGIGPGGSIVGMKFERKDPCVVYTASITGEIKQIDINRESDKTLLVTSNPGHWFSSLDVCYDKKFILAGDTLGYCSLITDDGVHLWSPKKRMHKSKVTHVEFSPADPHIFVTTSLDASVKLWDLRMLSETILKSNPLRIFPHQIAVNSAYFSPSNRQSLLTTDQLNEIRVYRSPAWNDELIIIPHPHRQFQYVTQIKATWHPLEDIIMVGRFPDKKFLMHDERTLDFYDGNSGDLLLRKNLPIPFISSLNAYNITGDSILSGANSALIFWKDENVL